MKPSIDCGVVVPFGRKVFPSGAILGLAEIFTLHAAPPALRTVMFLVLLYPFGRPFSFSAKFVLFGVVSHFLVSWYNTAKQCTEKMIREGSLLSENKLPHDHGQSIAYSFHSTPGADEFGTVSEIFQQLCDASRMRIFWLLCHCEACVVNLASMVNMSSPAVSHHLRQLRTSGLVASRREGKEVYYKAADNETVRLLHHLIEQLIRISCPQPASGPQHARKSGE